MHHAIPYVRCVGRIRLTQHGSSSSAALHKQRDPAATGWARRQSYSTANASSSYCRLSCFWMPTLAKSSDASGGEDAHALLVRAGFIRQTQSGIFHMLPLGARVLNKVERLIDRHMEAIGAAKASLSTLSTEALWEKSGRLTGKDSELFHLADRHDTKMLLAPTHEEEITSLVANAVHSYKDLPLRLFQVSRKYRDELRPRSGLLRGREFTMKDLYTFDAAPGDALRTYEVVRKTYSDMFGELKLPFHSVPADSGAIGGDVSHEYHLLSDSGEDTVLKCSEDCGFCASSESTTDYDKTWSTGRANTSTVSELFLSKDRRTLYHFIWPDFSAEQDHIPHRQTSKRLLPDIDHDFHDSLPPDEDRLSLWVEARGNKIVTFYDPRFNEEDVLQLQNFAEEILTFRDPDADAADELTELFRAAVKEEKQPMIHGKPVLLAGVFNGAPCPACAEGRLIEHKAIEIGHTFHLGDRYSKPLDLTIRDRDNKLVNVQMGCHGVGVSRLIAAVADVKKDKEGLNWPVVMAPFSVLVVPAKRMQEEAADVAKLLDTQLSETADKWDPNRQVDVALDDRDKPFGWKMSDADLIGYPVIVVVGRAYAEHKMVEVQCRQLGLKEEVYMGNHLGPQRIYDLLGQL